MACRETSMAKIRRSVLHDNLNLILYFFTLTTSQKKKKKNKGMLMFSNLEPASQEHLQPSMKVNFTT